MLLNIFILGASLYLVVQGAMFAIRYATLLAESYRLSTYTVGFIIVAVISILPETFISITAAMSGMPSFGLGMLLGSNVADLTLVFAGVILLSRRALKVEYKILKEHALYPFILLFPIVLGLDGHLSRPEGGVLIMVGVIFYYLALRRGVMPESPSAKGPLLKPWIFLLLSMGLLLVGAHYTVESASDLASMLGVSSVLIGMLIVGLGTTLPEFFFSLKAMKAKNDSLAIGDILGTVLADATIVVGILALIHPFVFPQVIIYVAGVFMVAAAFILFSFMRSGRMITSKEAFVLIVFWFTFALIEAIVNA
jgi:cation:H+ antiporter